MRSIDVTFTGFEGVLLAGTLTLPDGNGPFPAVICVHGSGNVDRNENPDHKSMLESYEKLKAEGKPTPDELPEPYQWNIFKDVAAALAGAGIACLRYDKRGTGQSGGSNKIRPLTALLYDVRAGISLLCDQPQIDGKRLGVFGHSEGGYIGPMICAGDPSIKALCFMGGPATNLLDILHHQVCVMTGLSNEKKIEAGLDLQRDFEAEWQQFVADIRAGKEWGLMPMSQQVHLQWWREHYYHDPVETIQRVKCPIMVLQGEKDYQVPAHEAELLGQALAAVHHPDYEIHVFPDLNHIMFATKGVSDGTEYGDPRGHLDAEVLGNIVRWYMTRL